MLTHSLSTALKTLIGLLQQHYGIWGSLTAAVVLIWWQWSKIKELPGVEPFVRLLKDRAVRLKRRVASSIDNDPRDNDRFAIAIARLIDDNEKSEFKELVVEELKTFSGIWRTWTLIARSATEASKPAIIVLALL